MSKSTRRVLGAEEIFQIWQRRFNGKEEYTSIAKDFPDVQYESVASAGQLIKKYLKYNGEYPKFSRKNYIKAVEKINAYKSMMETERVVKETVEAVEKVASRPEHIIRIDNAISELREAFVSAIEKESDSKTAEIKEQLNEVQEIIQKEKSGNWLSSLKQRFNI